MNQDKVLIVFLGFCAIGLSLIEAYGRHVCQYNVKVPYTRKVNKTEYIRVPGYTNIYGGTKYREVTSVVEEMAYKYEIQSKCCSGYVGPIENCMRTSSTPQDSTSPFEVSPYVTDTTESSTGFSDIKESTNMVPETSSDKTEKSELSMESESDYGTTPAEIIELHETIATKENWWSFPILFLCIVSLVAFIALLVKILEHRKARQSYVVNEKDMPIESHC